VLRNIGSNWVLTVLTVAVSYVMTPFVVHTLGQSGYGTWTLITAIYDSHLLSQTRKDAEQLTRVGSSLQCTGQVAQAGQDRAQDER